MYQWLSCKSYPYRYEWQNITMYHHISSQGMRDGIDQTIKL
ncbi:hypothetical protein GAGA_0492 [Paraglaciecola agarilytica NO2]|uniref:Uncharacterized protein n=1 Tax=Paraglaciecola agarilytica NO2 TaxID=1125747 RepID=A0ABQ0I229_9ALTE|nr:hypothetical protein GAGA_0492 [Paraglaciecola agarilytica NO2]